MKGGVRIMLRDHTLVVAVSVIFAGLGTSAGHLSRQAGSGISWRGLQCSVSLLIFLYCS